MSLWKREKGKTVQDFKLNFKLKIFFLIFLIFILKLITHFIVILKDPIKYSLKLNIVRLGKRFEVNIPIL